MSPLIAIDEQAIRERAHERWLSRGCPLGTSEQDWLEAERELSAESIERAPRSIRVAQPSETRSQAPLNRTRQRAPRSIVTRATPTPAARLLVALATQPSGSRRG
jgi:hypothetical protein